MQKKGKVGDQDQAAKIHAFYVKERRMPSYAEAAKVLGYKSKDSAFKTISKLVTRGMIDRDRTGKLVPKSGKINTDSGVRLLGLVEAGFPTPAEETDLDHITLDEWLIGNKAATFMLKVKGDSMKGAGILTGDYVIVERTDKARTGSIVIADVDGAWTMKYLREDKHGYFLEAANSDYKSIRPKEALAISAVVKAVVRKYA